jgi:hypothetical protein
MRALPIVCIAFIALYGAALRLNAITGTYGVVSSPAWLASLQHAMEPPMRTLQPRGIDWIRAPLYPHANGTETHYRSDPYTYLEYARAMRHFSDAHRREPIFPFTTRLWLDLLSDQDVAVSFASAMFAVLAIVATYLLGAAAFSRPVGLAAAAAFAIEYTNISWNIAGWRDDAFTLGVVMFAYAVLRTTRRPSTGNAVFVGVVTAFAILVRITALSFVLPGMLWLLVAPRASRRDRLKLAAISAVVTAALAAPYIINCWRVFGNPLYAIDAVTPNLPDGSSAESQDGAFHYVRAKIAARPFQMLDIAALGLTEHPFTNKWDGFDPWVAGASRWLAVLCLIGLVLLVASRQGQLLLMLLITATVPFSLTWQLASDWRYTEHAYPFFLVAAAVAAAEAIQLLRPSSLRRWRDRPRESSGRLLNAVAATCAIAIGAGGVLWGIPVLLARETLATEGRAALVTGVRDRAFYGRGWSQPVTSGNVTQRFAARGATVWIPLAARQTYRATLRLDPFPRPLPDGPTSLPMVRVSLNGAQIGLLDLVWNPERVGSYDLTFPARLVHAGFNRLTLDALPRATPLSGAVAMPQPGLSDGAAFGMWYVLVERAHNESLQP